MPYCLFSYFDYSLNIKWPFVRPVDEMMSEEQSFASHLAFFTFSIPCSDDWPAAYETKSLNWCQWRILNILWVILNWCLSLPDFVMSCLSVHYNSLSIWKLPLIWYNDIELKSLQFANRVSRALVKQTLQGPYCGRSWADKVLWFGRGNLGLRIVRCDFEIYDSQTWKRSNIKFSRVFAQRTRILRERLNIKTLRKRWINLPFVFTRVF